MSPKIMSCDSALLITGHDRKVPDGCHTCQGRGIIGCTSIHLSQARCQLWLLASGFKSVGWSGGGHLISTTRPTLNRPGPRVESPPLRLACQTKTVGRAPICLSDAILVPGKRQVPSRQCRAIPRTTNLSPPMLARTLLAKPPERTRSLPTLVSETERAIGRPQNP